MKKFVIVLIVLLAIGLIGCNPTGEALGKSVRVNDATSCKGDWACEANNLFVGTGDDPGYRPYGMIEGQIMVAKELSAYAEMIMTNNNGILWSSGYLGTGQYLAVGDLGCFD